MIHYEVFVDSAYGSDVLDCDTLEEAIKKAEEWKKELTKTYEHVIITKVETTIVKEL